MDAGLRSLGIVLLIVAIEGCNITSPNFPFSSVGLYPMGPSQYMVTCVDSPKYCADRATKICPQGFDVASNTTNPADHGRMTMIIKCH